MTADQVEKLSELLSAYVDGELDERDSQRAAGILRQDPHARQLYAELKRTRELVQTLPRHAAPASIATDLLARLERSALLPESEAKPQARTRRRTWWRAPLSMAAVLGLCALGWWSLSLNPRESGDAFSAVDSPLGSMNEAPVMKPLPSGDTVEKKLAAGVKLASLQQHPFANEPVRLQLIVDNERERDAVVRRVSQQLAAANVPDLSRDFLKEEAAPGKQSDATFFYQGQPGVNFANANSHQLLVRAALRQVESVLKEVDRVARREDQLALQAGPLSMQGRRGIDALQLFAESAASQTERDSKERASAPPAAAVADARGQDEEAARFVRELLKTAGIDPTKMASAEGGRSDKDSRRARVAGELSPSGPAPDTATVAKSESATSAPVGAMTSPPENHLTFILEIVTKPKASPPANGRELRRSRASRTNSRSDSGRSENCRPS